MNRPVRWTASLVGCASRRAAGWKVFAELMMNGLVSGDKVREFSSDIYRESGRLIALVEDIIKLSRLDALDEQEADCKIAEHVDICSLCEDALDTLSL